MLRSLLRFFSSAVLVVMLAACAVTYSWPMEFPISLRTQQNFESSLDVKRRHFFEIFLSFLASEQADQSRLRGLLGTGYRDPPDLKRLPTPLRVTILARDGVAGDREIFRDEINDAPISGATIYTVDRKIGHTVLQPGTYLVKVQVLQGVPALDQTPAAIRILPRNG